MALAVNLVRDPRRTPAAKPNDFNPYAPKPKKPIFRGKQLEILRDVFVRNAPVDTAVLLNRQLEPKKAEGGKTEADRYFGHSKPA